MPIKFGSQISMLPAQESQDRDSLRVAIAALYAERRRRLMFEKSGARKHTNRAAGGALDRSSADPVVRAASTRRSSYARWTASGNQGVNSYYESPVSGA